MKIIKIALKSMACLPLVLTYLSFPAHAETAVCHKLLFIGDSITKHGPAVQTLGWSGNWGMAASDESKDYVHLFLSRLAAAQGLVRPELMISGAGGGKVTGTLSELPKFTSFKADLAVIQLGENDNQNVNAEGFQRPYEQIVEAIRAGNPHARIFCFGVWSPPNGNPQKDAMIQDVCRKSGAIFVDMKSANARSENKALSEKRFTHDGVNWHPGDKGMESYAEALWQAFQGNATFDLKTPTPVESNKSRDIFVEDWNTGGNPAWKPAPRIEKVGTQHLACMHTENPDANNTISITLPPEAIKGHRIAVTAQVKGNEISAKPNTWNGVKVMLRLQNAEGQLDYPQAEIPVGTFDWKAVRLEKSVPDNIVEATLNLGLEKASGTVWFDAVKVTVLP